MQFCPDQLRERYREGRLLPFVGAGASMAVSWEGDDGKPRRGPSMLSCDLFYTTNFDDILERAFALHNRPTVVSALEMQMGAARTRCEIIKFHGDLNHPDQVVLTESDYEKRLAFSTPMDFRLRSDLLGRVILFLGYSFRDANVSYLFRLFTDKFFDKAGGLRGARAYIATPDPSDFERELFAARRIEVIPIGGMTMTDDIVTLLREIRS